MSTESTNHAAEAMALRNLAAMPTVPGQAEALLLTAQVHATLALVEQQRIANLIALAESGRTTVNGARAALAGLYDGSAEEGSAYMALRPDIAAALGLTDGADR